MPYGTPAFKAHHEQALPPARKNSRSLWKNATRRNGSEPTECNGIEKKLRNVEIEVMA